jgi:hypothetical protein
LGTLLCGRIPHSISNDIDYPGFGSGAAVAQGLCVFLNQTKPVCRQKVKQRFFTLSDSFPGEMIEGMG